MNVYQSSLVASFDLTSSKLPGSWYDGTNIKTREKFGNEKIRATELVVGNSEVVMIM